MTEYISSATAPGADGDFYGLPGQQGLLYSWMRILAGGGTSEFSEVRMRGAIYDKNGVEILGGGGGGGSLSTLSDVALGVPFVLTPGNLLVYSASTKWTNAPSNAVVSLSLNDLTDVSYVLPLEEGQRLVWTSNQWNNRYSYRIFAGTDGLANTLTPAGAGIPTLVTFGASPLTVYDSSSTPGLSATNSGITTPNVGDPIKWQYTINVEAIGTNTDDLGLRVYLNGVPHGPVLTENIKNAEKTIVALSGTFTQSTGLVNVQLYFISAGNHAANFTAVSFTVIEL